MFRACGRLQTLFYVELLKFDIIDIPANLFGNYCIIFRSFLLFKRMNSNKLKIENLWRPLIIVVATLFLYFYVILNLVRDWYSDENYSFGLLIPFVIGYIIWTNFDKLKESVGKPQYLLGGLLTCFALLMLLAGLLGAEIYFQRLSLIIILAGILIYFYGAHLVRMLAIPFLLLFLSIPIPQILFNKVAFPLQIYASQLAVWLIRASGVPTLRMGNVIEILPRNAVQVISLEVVEACSGIRSLMTLVTLGLILVYFTRTNKNYKPTNFFSFVHNKDFWRGVIVMGSAIPIAIVTNGGRVAATGILTYYYGMWATKGLAHDVAGWLVYIVALLILILVNYIMLKIFGKEDSENV